MRGCAFHFWRAGVVAASCAACSSEPAAVEHHGSDAAGDGSPGPDADAVADALSDVDAASDAAVEPKGPTSFSLVHGVVDAPQIAFCFRQVVAGSVTPASGVITPTGGLAFGQSVTVLDLGGFDWSGDDIQPVVIAGDIASLSDESCFGAVAAADAGASITIAPLPVMPAGSITGGRPYALVATGCLGGAGHDAADAAAICGAGYAPASPTLDSVIVPLSRIADPARVGLQALNASRASGAVDFALVPSGAPIAASVAYGVVSPWPPLLAFDAGTLSSASVRVESGGATPATFGFPAAPTFANGGDYAIVLLGPDPTRAGGSWWNAPMIAVIESGAL